MDKLKKISEKDLLQLNKHYLNFEPYSDFNVVSIWGYMVPGARYIQDQGAILYEMRDYNTSRPYMTIMGDFSARRLIRQIAQEWSNPVLTLYSVPESTYATAFKDWRAVVSAEEDESNHDYIFSVDSIARLDDVKYKDKRKKISKLLSKHPNLVVKEINHHSLIVRLKMYKVFRRWVKESGSKTWKREYRALKRALNLRGFHIVCIAAYEKTKMVGFTVNEIEKNNYYQGHYGKAGYKYPGLGLLLEHETAKLIKARYHSKYMNLQQDLGIEGIRYYKKSLHPLKQLKKYDITVDTELARTEA